MNKGRRSMLGLALLGGLQPLTGTARGVPRIAALDAELRAIVADPACELASLSVLAIRSGEVVHEQAYGRRRIGGNGAPDLPATPDTVYRIASVSKLVTTLGLMRLLEAGKVALDADVSSYLGFHLRNPHFPQQPITLRQLLSHTASLRDDAGYSFPVGVRLREVLVRGGALYGEGRMWAKTAAPGDYFTYSNLGWGIVGTLMERVAGARFDRLMAHWLLEPLELTAAYHPSMLPAPALARLATLYRKRTVDTEVWDPQGPWIAQADDVAGGAPALPGLDAYVPGENATPFSPTGGLRISARGLGTLMRMLMGGGEYGGRRILQAATLERMFARAWTFDPVLANGDTEGGLYNCWGLGNAQFPDLPGRRLVAGFEAVGHLGDAYGLRAVFAFDRARRDGMVVLVGGTGSDPLRQPGRYSALARFEERILTSLHRHALGGGKPRNA